MATSKQHMLIGALAGLVGLTASIQATGQTRPVPPIVAAWSKAWNKGDAPGMAALFTADGVYEDYAFQASWKGRRNIEQWVTLTAANIPDTRVEILEAWQAGDRVTVRWTFHGTPKRLADLPGTGKSFSVSAVSVFELERGRIRRASDVYNLANLLRQLGMASGAWTPPFGPDVLK